MLGFEAYRRLFADANFLPAFSESLVNAVAAIFLSLLIIVPTAYWVTLRLPRLRPVVEFITLLPFVIPPVVLVFGLIRLYSRPPLLLTATYDSSRGSSSASTPPCHFRICSARSTMDCERWMFGH